MTSFAQSEVVEKPRLSIVHTHENREFSELLQSFTDETGIALDIIWMDQADLKSRIINISQLNQVPDIIIAPSDNIGLSDYGLFSEVPKELLSKDLLPDSITAVTLNDKVYGVPIIHGNHLLLYYNKTLTQHPPESWQKLIEQKQQLPESVELISWSFMEMYWFIPFITAFGEVPLIKDKPNLDTPAMRQALVFVWQQAKNNIVDIECSYNCAIKKFSEGKVAYTINGIWAYKNLKKELDENLGIAVMPKINGKPMLSYSSSIVATFPKQSLSGENHNSIKKFISYIQSPSFQSSLWPKLNELPALASEFDNFKKQPDSDVQLLLKTLENTRPMSSHKNMSIVWEALLKGFTRFGSGAWNEKRATNYMQKTATRSIQSENK